MEIFSWCEQCGFDDDTGRGVCSVCDPVTEPEYGFHLRPYQREAIGAVMEGFKDRKTLLVVAATGLGKTVMLAEIARRFVEGAA